MRWRREAAPPLLLLLLLVVVAVDSGIEIDVPWPGAIAIRTAIMEVAEDGVRGREAITNHREALLLRVGTTTTTTTVVHTTVKIPFKVVVRKLEGGLGGWRSSLLVSGS
jgi:hypothetical protein